MGFWITKSQKIFTFRINNHCPKQFCQLVLEGWGIESPGQEHTALLEKVKEHIGNNLDILKAYLVKFETGVYILPGTQYPQDAAEKNTSRIGLTAGLNLIKKSIETGGSWINDINLKPLDAVTVKFLEELKTNKNKFLKVMDSPDGVKYEFERGTTFKIYFHLT